MKVHHANQRRSTSPTQFHTDGVSLLFDAGLSREKIEQTLEAFLDSYFSREYPRSVVNQEREEEYLSYRLFL